MRKSWLRYALDLAEVAASRSEDPYVQVGAVVLRPDNSVAGIGYNGAPSGLEIDWTNRDERRKYVIHAEPNAMRYVTPAEVRGGWMAVTGPPCMSCLTGSIAPYGIQTVIVGGELENYPIDDCINVAAELGIDVRLWVW